MELANEGLRYMDLIRWKLASKALNSYNYIMLAPDDLQNNIVAKGLWFWPSTPLIDDDGLADFSTMYNAGQIAVGAKSFPTVSICGRYLLMIWNFVLIWGITMDINFLRKS